MQIERETMIAAPVERVWSLLTEPEHVGDWFCDAGAEIDLRPGGAMVLRWTEHGTTHARVVDVEPHRRFSYRWAAEAESEQIEGNSTLVEFTLDPTDEGTRLRVVESGFEDLAVTDEQRRARVEDNTEGWEIQLRRVRERAESVTA
jgi:uncharacterized protein YndB with AHSA1/START domain